MARRVLIVNQYAAPAGAASGTRHGDIGAELARRGHDVTIVAAPFDYLSRRRVERPSEVMGVRFAWVDAGAYRQNDGRRAAGMLRFAWNAARVDAPADVVIGSSPSPFAAVAGQRIARRLRVPFVLEVRDFWPSSLSLPGPMTWTLERLERWLYRSADHIVTIPPRGDLRLAELGISKPWTHIPNAAPAHPLEFEPHDGIRIVYAGAFGPANALGDVIEAVRLLGDRAPEVEMIGDGPMRAELMERAPERVTFPGVLPKGEVRRRLARADAGLVSLMPSPAFRYGLSPNKMADYLAAGLPVLIASDYPTPIEVEGAGFRYSPGARGLADAMVQLMSSDVAELRRNAGRLAASYRLDQIADQWERIVEAP